MDGLLMAKCSCSHCGNHIEFPLEGAGLTIPCPHCTQSTRLDLEAPPLASSDKPSAAELINAFSGTISRPPTSLFYHLGLILVGIVMLLLPVVYLLLVGAAAWGWWFCASHFSFLLQPMRGGSLGIYLIQLALYLGPLFMGLVVVLFMIKPLFARRRRHSQPLAMNPGVERTLYAFIAKICDVVGAPMPTRIDLDCELNASAGFRRGMLSLLGHDLVLTIGLPLVETMTLREFAGVVAHEFGHFTQGFGMRLSYVIRRINGWFFRVVYERDAWDVWLDNLYEDAGDWRILLVLLFTRMAVGFSRLLLKLLMLSGHGVCCFLLRQMEYDADSYAAKLAGSDTVESTARKLAVLAEVLPVAYKQMLHGWKSSRRLPDDFPAYLVHHHSKISAAVRDQITDTMGLAKTGIFDTHPSRGDRIRRARIANEPGIFHLDWPAKVLFSNFDVASKQVTHLHYADDLGIPFSHTNLRPVEATPSEAQAV
jgi:Zn-dependent protease with chaperone function